MAVLVVAGDLDPTADVVVRMLNDRGVPVLRTDLSQFPTRLLLHAELDRTAGWVGTLRLDDRELRLEEVRSVWYRDPTEFVFPDGLSRAELELRDYEATDALIGVLTSLDALWVNPLDHLTGRPIPPPYQPYLAATCGVQVSGFSTDEQECPVLRLVDRFEDTMITRALGPTDTAQSPATPSQESAPPPGEPFEVRLFVIGSEWFPIAVWASGQGVRACRLERVPNEVTEGVLRYMVRLRLVCVAVDLVVNEAGEWVVLDIDSVPRFAWLETTCGAPITAATADLLARGRSARPLSCWSDRVR